MKRTIVGVALAALVVSPAAAQWAGMPVWNSPKGGQGIGIYADYSDGNEDSGNPSSYGIRGSLGLGTLTVTLGYTSSDLDLPDNYSTFGGNVAFRVIGGSLSPVALNLQAGAARTGEANAAAALTRYTLGGGVSVSLPTPGINLEPYISVTNRWNSSDDFLETESNLGWTIGANAGFGMFGVHIAYDSEDAGDTTSGFFGIGAHVNLRVPGL